MRTNSTKIAARLALCGLTSMLGACGFDQPAPVEPIGLARPTRAVMEPPTEQPDIPDCESEPECRGDYYSASRLHDANLADQVRALQRYVNTVTKDKAR